MTATATSPANAEPVKVVAPLPDIAPISITRNGVSLTLVVQAESKGPSQGEPFMFLAPEDPVTLADLASWADADWVLDAIKRVIKKDVKGVYSDSVAQNNGTFDAVKFSAKLEAYKFYRESKAELLKQQGEVTQSLIDLYAKTDISMEERQKQAEVLVARIHDLKLAIDLKSRKVDDDNDDSGAQASN